MIRLLKFKGKEFLVKWLDYSSFESSWEPMEHLTEECLRGVFNIDLLPFYHLYEVLIFLPHKFLSELLITLIRVDYQ